MYSAVITLVIVHKSSCTANLLLLVSSAQHSERAAVGSSYTLAGRLASKSVGPARAEADGWQRQHCVQFVLIVDAVLKRSFNLALKLKPTVSRPGVRVTTAARYS